MTSRWWLCPLTTLFLAAIARPGAAQFVEPEVEVLLAFEAEASGDGFGFVAEAVGDINGDRVPDFVIGAPFFGAGGTLAGKAYVYSGRDGQLLHTTEGVPGMLLGFSVAGGKDLDGDWVPDVVVGGPGLAGPDATVRAISGASLSLIFDATNNAGEGFGYDINIAGDVNRDRRRDVIVGALAASGSLPQAGRAYLLSGRDGSVVWSQDGVTAGGNFGSAVSGLGDVNRDWVPDVVVGGRFAGASGTGEAYVLSGRDGSFLRTLQPEATAGTFGWFFAHKARRVDFDLVTDILVGDFSDNEVGPGAGKAYVFSGRTGRLLRVYKGENAGDGFGIGRSAGDVNWDFRSDFVLAAYLNSDGAAQAGKIYIYSGRRDQRLLRTMTGSVAGAQLGFDALAIGDVNGDYATDFLITGVDVAYVVAGIPPWRFDH